MSDMLVNAARLPNMRAVFHAVALILLSSAGSARAAENSSGPEIVQFRNQEISLAGELFMPKGDGPFPAILYNHGSAPGMSNSRASEAIGPLFASRGWVFFMPYRRGQGLSANAGPTGQHRITRDMATARIAVNSYSGSVPLKPG